MVFGLFPALNGQEFRFWFFPAQGGFCRIGHIPIILLKVIVKPISSTLPNTAILR